MAMNPAAKFKIKLPPEGKRQNFLPFLTINLLDKLYLNPGIPDFFVSTRVRFLIQTLNEKNLRPNEKRARLYEWTPISHAQ